MIELYRFIHHGGLGAYLIFALSLSINAIAVTVVEFAIRRLRVFFVRALEAFFVSMIPAKCRAIFVVSVAAATNNKLNLTMGAHD